MSAGRGRECLFSALLCVFVLAGAAWSEDSEIVKNFKNARLQNDEYRMQYVVEKNKEKIPDEIKALVDMATASGATEEDKKENFYIAELLATSYKDIFGDVEPLRGVKRRYFDSLLGPPVRSIPQDGVHAVEMPQFADPMKNVLVPDNIIIKRGETVRFVNKATATHILASMPLISEGGLFSPNIEPGQNWRYKFEKAGVYYYFCFIHRSMIGKITVEDAE